MSIDDRLGIHELMGRAAFALDERDLDVLEASFAGDAVMSVKIAGSDPLGPFDGREAIMGLMKDSMAQQTDQRRHVVSNLFIDDADPERPSVTSYLTLFGTENGEVQLICTGIYRDEVRRENGRWVLARRHLDLDRPF